MAAWRARWGWQGWLALGLVLAVLLGVALSTYLASLAAPLMEQAAQIPDAKERVAAQKDILQYQTDNQLKIWTAIVQAVAAAVLAIGGYFTWRNLRATQERLEIDRSAQITNRFTQAIGQLGAELKDGTPNLEVRLGGIYALERLSRDSAVDYWTIMEVLIAYVRQNAPAQGHQTWSDTLLGGDETSLPQEAEPSEVQKPRLDIQAVLTVLGRRTPPEGYSEPHRLDLNGTHLVLANLHKANLEKASPSDANLLGAFLSQARLAGAVLLWTNLKRAHLGEADLKGAFLMQANLQNADLRGASLVDADLSFAKLQGADLQGADLRGARLLGANLRRSEVRERQLFESDAQNLTQEQLESAEYSQTTKLPSYLQVPGETAPR
jgi:uncharacterized protein YjbI with pentapeptide repeats